MYFDNHLLKTRIKLAYYEHIACSYWVFRLNHLKSSIERTAGKWPRERGDGGLAASWPREQWLATRNCTLWSGRSR